MSFIFFCFSLETSSHQPLQPSEPAAEAPAAEEQNDTVKVTEKCSLSDQVMTIGESLVRLRESQR